MRKLLWIGDAACDSGFARCTHQILDVLRLTWDVTVLGLNYRGDPHPYPYPIYPARNGGDIFGVARISELVATTTPDLVVVQNDPWNFPDYLKVLANLPVVGIVAVDGENCRGRQLNGLALAIFWTEFAQCEAALGGYSGPSTTIPLGVDLSTYRTVERKQARAALGLPARLHDAYIVGNVNRNQPRKRLDLTISYFAEWVKKYQIDDAYLFLHVAPTGDRGYDCQQLMSYYGINRRLILSEPDVYRGESEQRLVLMYSSFDVQVSTTQGEGWGLCTMEGMACGVPQIVPAWSALCEWTEDAAVKVPCSTIACTPNKINVVGGVPDREEFIASLDRLYHDAAERQRLSERGRRLVERDEFRWPNIGQRYAHELNALLATKVEP